MSKRIQVTIPFDQSLEQTLKTDHPNIRDFRLISRSLDARGAPKGRKPRFVYQLDVVYDSEVFKNTKRRVL